MTRLRFVQISDVHLDSTLTGGRLRLPPARAARRRRELREVFLRALDLARDRNADVLLIPGDLFDDESISTDTVNFVIDSLAAFPDLPVIIAPGNHDHYSLASPYCAELRASRGLPPWPDHVRIVSETRFTAFRHPALPDASFTAMGHDRNRPVDERLLASPLPRHEAPFQLLVFHGSREHFAPSGKMVTLPFSDAELAAQGFHYAAIGHYHSFGTVESRGRVIGCYAGCPAARYLDEPGKKFVVAGELRREGNAVQVEIEPVRLDPREVGHVRLSVHGATHRDALLDRVARGVEASGFTSDDLLLVELTGRLPRGIDPHIPVDFLEDRYFHVAFDTSGLKPDYDLQVYLRRGFESTEGRFVRDLRARIDAAGDPEERRVLEAALYYGLDALIQGEVLPRYEG